MAIRKAAVVFSVALFASAAPAGAQDEPAARAATTAVVAVESRPYLLDDDRGAPMLGTLYASFFGLQAYDGYATLTGIRRGAAEWNPVTRSVAANPAAFWSVKIGLSLTTVYLAERMRRQHHRVQATVVMLASNGVIAVVAAHNAAALRRAPR